MFGVTGQLSSIDYRNTSFIGAEAKNIVIFTVAPVTDANWKKVNSFDNTPIANNLIKSRNTDFSLVGYSNTTLNVSFNLNGVVATGGGHSGNDGPPVTSHYVYSGGGTYNSTTGYTGDHTHTTITTVTFTNNSFLPTHIKTGIYQRNLNSLNPIVPLPIGTIVFAENILNNSGVVANSSYDSKYLCIASTDGSIGTIGGSNTAFATTDSTSGSHSHGGSTSGSVRGAGSQGTINYTYYGTIFSSSLGGHVHLVSVPTNHYKKYVKLRTYVVQKNNTYISSGMIFGFTSNIVSPDWYCCNGQTVHGYTTPNLVDRYIMCGNSNITSHNTIPATNDVNKVIYSGGAFVNSADWMHTHGSSAGYGGGQLQQAGDVSVGLYHDSYNKIHSHSISASTTFTSDFEPNHFNLIYYIYLP